MQYITDQKTAPTFSGDLSQLEIAELMVKKWTLAGNKQSRAVAAAAHPRINRFVMGPTSKIGFLAAEAAVKVRGIDALILVQQIN